MSEVQVTPVASDADQEAFFDLPEMIYQGDANWVPPIRSTIAKQLSEQNPFNEYGEFQPFLARQNGRVVGRIVSSINHRLAEKENRKIGLFGYFECIDDQVVAHALLDTACDWLQKKGCVLGRGPIDLSTHINCLFLVDGFESSPYIMMPYNPDYYPKMVESAGWQTAKNAYAYDYHMKHLSPAFDRSYQRALAAGIEFRPIRVKGSGFEEDCRSLYQVFTKSFSENWSSTPRNEDEFLEEARELRQIADPDLFPIAEHEGKMIGFWMGLPDYNIALQHVGGRLNLIGILKLLWHRRKIDRARVIAMGVLPEYQHPRLAVGPALIYLGMQGGSSKPGRYKRAELSWVWEDNKSSVKLIESSNGIRYKTYRIYEKPLTPTPS